jgi:hypothetical protein
MSIATLFRHVDIDVPRYVTVNGTVVTDPGLAPGGLSVEPHRFHGGVEPKIAGSDLTSAWWNQDVKRRQADEAAMQKYFPGVALHAEDGEYLWFGTIDSGRGTFKVGVAPRIDGSLPIVISLNRTLARNEGGRQRWSPHLYDSGSLCVAAFSDWDPARHTTATAVGWAAHWFAAYTIWRMSGEWPTEGYGRAA